MIRDRSASSIVLDILVYGFCWFTLIVTLFPFLNIVATSISGNSYVVVGNVSFFPRDVTFEAYVRVLTSWLIPNAFKNSVVYTVLSTVYSVLLTVTMAYPLTKRDFVLNKAIWIMLVITMYFSGGMIPLFLLVRQVGIFNSLWTQVLPCAIAIGNLILLRMFFNTIPRELEESAFLDGANDAQILFRVILPLSKAGIATITLYYAVWKWNDFFNPMLYFKDYAKLPLTVVMREIIIQGTKKEMFGAIAGREADMTVYSEAYDTRLKYAVLMLALLPIIMVYPILQKYFIKGMLIGSVKG